MLGDSCDLAKDLDRQRRRSRSAFLASYSSVLIAPRSWRSARLASVRVTSSALMCGRRRRGLPGALLAGAARRRSGGGRRVARRAAARREQPRAGRAPARSSRSGGDGSGLEPDSSSSSSCFASSIARLKSSASRSFRSREIPLSRRGQDVEVAEAEDPAEERLGEDRVVDLLERAVGDLLVDDALELQHAPGRDDVLLVHPAQDLPAHVDQAADDDDDDDPAERVRGPAPWPRLPLRNSRPIAISTARIP